ncbi:MAG: ABC-type iron transport system FetAB ATPase subunit, partial [Candidatus Promineifilaceae bacterium]
MLNIEIIELIRNYQMTYKILVVDDETTLLNTV